MWSSTCRRRNRLRWEGLSQAGATEGGWELPQALSFCHFWGLSFVFLNQCTLHTLPFNNTADILQQAGPETLTYSRQDTGLCKE